MTWPDDTTRYLFFTGKGGVGKTSIACATAIRLADIGKRVLLVSTDPASNLDHVLEVNVGDGLPTPVPEVSGLEALNVDPESLAQAYRERIIGPVREFLPMRAVQSMEEQLSGACTTEIASFDEFTSLLTNDAKTERFAHIVFDTAPTGHTLRLLKLPTAWSSFLRANPGASSCVGPLAGLDKQKRQYAEAVQVLSDARRTTMVLVARARPDAIAEAARTGQELSELGISNQRLVVNGLMPSTVCSDPLAETLRQRQQDSLRCLPEFLARMPTQYVSLQPENLVGIDSLRSLLAQERPACEPARIHNLDTTQEMGTVERLIAEIEKDGRGLIMVMGKGGVGKTSIAAAIATELAARNHSVHLTTTDPAAHEMTTIINATDRLKVSRIDPEAETEQYRQYVLRTKTTGLDQAGRALLEEDLRSPCTEEVAVYHALARVMAESDQRIVVVDTAPTGHTLLLLDAAGAYDREIARHGESDTRAVTPMARLQDPARTKILIVTLPETTPVLEASRLQQDLRRANIDPWAWVINASLLAARPSDPLLSARAVSEKPQIEYVRQHLAERIALVPFLAVEPLRREGLRAIVHGETIAKEPTKASVPNTPNDAALRPLGSVDVASDSSCEM